MCLHDHRLLCVRACARYTALLPPPTRTHKSYTILFSNFRYFCKQRTTLFFIVTGSTVKARSALGIVFEAPPAKSHSARTLQFHLWLGRATCIFCRKRSERQLWLQYWWELAIHMPQKTYMSVWTAKIKENKLSNEAICSIFQLQRSFIYCRCKTKYEGFLFCLRVFTCKPPSKLITFLPSREWKRCWWRGEWMS